MSLQILSDIYQIGKEVFGATNMTGRKMECYYSRYSSLVVWERYRTEADSLQKIADIFDLKNHTSVMHGISSGHSLVKNNFYFATMTQKVSNLYHIGHWNTDFDFVRHPEPGNVIACHVGNGYPIHGIVINNYNGRSFIDFATGDRRKVSGMHEYRFQKSNDTKIEDFTKAIKITERLLNSGYINQRVFDSIMNQYTEAMDKLKGAGK